MDRLISAKNVYKASSKDGLSAAWSSSSEIILASHYSVNIWSVQGIRSLIWLKRVSASSIEKTEEYNLLQTGTISLAIKPGSVFTWPWINKVLIEFLPCLLFFNRQKYDILLPFSSIYHILDLLQAPAAFLR